MSRKRFLAQLIIAFCVFLLFNAGIAQRSNRLPSRQHLLVLDNAPPFDTLFIGNSLVAHGIDTDEFTAASNGKFGVPLNLGLNSSQTVEHLMLFRRAARKQPHLKLYVYGYFTDMLTQSPSYAKGLVGHQTLSYILEPSIASKYYTHTPAERLQFWLYSKVPYLTEQNTLWEKVELLRRRLEAIGLPPAAGNEMGRLDDFKKLAVDEAKERTAARDAVVEKDLGLTDCVRDMLSQARSHAARTVVINMPVTAVARAPLGRNDPYTAYTRKKVEEQGAEFLDASDWITDPSLFVDAIHLSPKGAQIFSRRLGEELAHGPVSDPQPIETAQPQPAASPTQSQP